MNCPKCNTPFNENNVCPNCGQTKKERGNLTFPMNPLSKPLSVGSYLLMILIGIIPLVNIILYLIWAFSPNTNINRKNYARAMLFIWLIVILACVGIILSMIYLFHFDIPIFINYYF